MLELINKIGDYAVSISITMILCIFALFAIAAFIFLSISVIESLIDYIKDILNK